MKTLAAVCKNCTKGTHKVYSTNIRRLYKMFKEKIKTLAELPKTKAWLMSDKLEKAYKALPVNVRRHLSSSAFIATKMYGMKPENKRAIFMTKDVKAYEENRNLNKKSDYENANIPKGGLKDIAKALKVYKGLCLL